MKDQSVKSHRLSAGACLILSFVLAFFGARIFAGRRSLDPFFISRTSVELEQGLFIAAVIATVIGFFLLQQLLHNLPGHSLVRIGAITYQFGGVMMVVSTAIRIVQGEHIAPLIITYWLLALLGQATIGVGIIRSDSVPGVVGWLAVLFNLSLLVVLPIVTPDDIYFPIQHHVIPLVIGISLLVREIRPTNG